MLDTVVVVEQKHKKTDNTARGIAVNKINYKYEIAQSWEKLFSEKKGEIGTQKEASIGIF